MEIRIPEIITASSKLSVELAERAHLSTPSLITRTPTALILPEWPAHLDDIREQLLEHPTIERDCPVLSVPVTPAVLEALGKKLDKEYYVGTFPIERHSEHETLHVDVHILRVRVAGESFTLLFDIREKTTNEALHRWMSLGFIPAYCRVDGLGGVVKMFFDPNLAGSLARAAQGLTSASVDRFSICAEFADPLVGTSQSPDSEAIMLVSGPKNLPQALGLGSRVILCDGIEVGTAEIKLTV